MIRPNQSPQPIEPGHRNQPRRKLTRIAGVLAAAVVISWGGPAANAFWQTLGSNAGAARADAILAVAAPSAVVSGGAASISWKQGTTAEGRPVGGYTVARYSSASGGIKVSGTGGCAGIITVLTCSEASLPAGTWYYTVTPVLGAWVGVESARSAGIAGDSTPPAAPTITAPAVINSANAGSVPVSGAVEPGSSVTITVKDAGAVHTLAQTVTANGSGQWTASNFNLALFTDGTITYSAVATDAAGNASIAGTATSAKDTAAPAVTVALVNGPDAAKNQPGFADAGDKVVISYSETMNASSICSAWTSNATNYTINGNNAVSIQINGKVLTASVSGCQVLRIGDVALDGTYGTTAGPLVFGGSGGNVSSITWNASGKTLTLTLGKLASGGPAQTAAGNGSPTVAPPTGVTDVNGNQAVGALPASPSRF